MTVRWGEPRPSVLERSGHAGTLVLVLILVAILATLAGTL